MVRMRNHVTHRQRLFAALALSLLLAGPICVLVMWERTGGMVMRDATRVWIKGVPQEWPVEGLEKAVAAMEEGI
jgi:hypothetical protein